LTTSRGRALGSGSFFFAEGRLSSPGGIPALICVDPDDGNGGYYSDNTPAAAVGNGAFRMQEFESR
jgi:hypothetical protein